MKDQMNLPLGRSLKQTGQRRALSAESKRFRNAAREILIRLAQTHAEFTSDDLWITLPDDVRPEHPNSIGPIFRWAAISGLIESTGKIIQSNKAASHARNIQIWRSKLL